MYNTCTVCHKKIDFTHDVDTDYETCFIKNIEPLCNTCCFEIRTENN